MNTFFQSTSIKKYSIQELRDFLAVSAKTELMVVTDVTVGPENLPMEFVLPEILLVMTVIMDEGKLLTDI